MKFIVPAHPELKGNQGEAFEHLKAWYNDPDTLMFTLKGYAGTGKTHLLKYFLDKVVTKGVCVTAPTHKAVKVIEQHTGRQGKTFQSLHGLRPNVNLERFNTNNLLFDTIGTEYIRDYALVVIDECGQINKALFDLTEERAKRYKTKVLFVGDPAQLPPINERYSKAFAINGYEMTDIIRQEIGNPLLEVLGLLRKDIINQTSTALKYVWNKGHDVNAKGEGFVRVNQTQFNTQLLAHMQSEGFSKDISFAKYSCWTNASINMYNKFIRTNLLHTEAILDVNDLLTGYRTIVDEFNDPIIVNSEDYILTSINRRISEHGFAIYVVTLYAINSKTSCTINIVDHQDDTYDVFYDIVSMLQQQAVHSERASKGKNWRKYYAFKDQYLSLIDITIPTGEDRHDTIPKDLDYGYGLTTHKLQGSTIDNMFINVLDMTCYKGNPTTPIRNTNQNPFAIELRNKLLYTAMSRARSKVYLLF